MPPTARQLSALLDAPSPHSTRAPRYVALAARVRLLIADGRLPVGVRLPAERDLAMATTLSRTTVAAAYRRLRDDGWAMARQGSGTWTALPTGSRDKGLGAWVPAPAEDGVIDLAHAAPPAPPAVAAALAAALSELPRLLPGHGYYPQGLPELRDRIAARYAQRGLPTSAEHILVTSGALHALTVVIEVLLTSGDRVVVENPSYPNALDALRHQGAHLVPVTIRGDQTDPDSTVADIQRAARATSAQLAYLMPDFQNPTGSLLDANNRQRLAAGLHTTGTTVIADETLVELGLDGSTPPPYASGTRADHAVSIGTVSKSFWGGLRLGWVRADPGLIRRLTASMIRSQMSGPVLEQLAACHLLDAANEALAEHRDRLRAQRAALLTALHERLPQWRAPVPPGGLVLWCELPSPISSHLVVAAEKRGLRLAAGPRFDSAPGFGDGAGFEDRLRLPYTQPVDVLRRAVDVLADVADTVTGEDQASAPDQLVV
jgi:DNA-binding transcriptional MocR family regulator